MATALDRIEQLIRLEGQALGVLRTLTDTVIAIAGQLKNLKGGAAPPKEAKTLSVFDQIKGVFGKIAKVVAIATAVVGAITAAFLAVPLAIAGIVHTATRFVRALNPSLVEAYEAQLDNLTATIGFGLVPIIAYATKSVREWAGILLPSIRAIRPIVDDIAHAVSGLTSGAIRILARVIQGTAALIVPLLPLIDSTLNSWGAMLETIAAVVDVLNQLDVGMNLVMDLFRLNADAMRTFAVGLAIASAKLLGAFGGADALAKFKQSLANGIDAKKNPTAGLVAAPKDAGVSGIEEISKKIAAAAFTAGAGGQTKPPDLEALEAIQKAVQGIEAKTLRELIIDGVKEGIAAARQATGEGARNAFNDVIGGGGLSTGVKAPGAGQLFGAVFNPAGTLADRLLGDS